jgi:hypothetical protein
MKRGKTAALVALVVACPPAWGYRPFDATDADVAEPSELELEVGATHRRSGGDRTWGSAAVANFGLGHQREVVIEGNLAEEHSPEGSSWRFEDAALSIKQILVAACCRTCPVRVWPPSAACARVLRVRTNDGAGGALPSSRQAPAPSLRI